jgi:hypothetical protein
MQRNKRRHGAEQLSVMKAVEWVWDTATDLWHILHTKEIKQQHPPVWKRPNPGWIKCNDDGSFDNANNEGAMGAILRDHQGCFVQGRAVWQDHAPDALTMEALALKDGLLLTQQCRVRQVCAETNCLQMLQLW